MTVSQFLTHVNYALRGTDESAPNIGEAEANYWLETYNRVKNEFYNDTKVLWEETWEVKSLGAISATATPSFNCDATLIAPSDQVYAVDTNSKKVYYDIIKAKERPRNGRYFYLAGMNPQVLYCTNEIESDEDIVGGTLYLPGYYMPADINVSSETGTSTIEFIDPYYAVLATAAEIAFNDLTFEDKYPDLAGKANNLRMQQVRRRRRNTYGTTRSLPRRTNRIENTETR